MNVLNINSKCTTSKENECISFIASNFTFQ
jgi:hypothetical protein